MKPLNVTGTQVHYYAVCHRKLWYFSHGIRLEDFNENVLVGKAIHEYAYGRKSKEVALGEDAVLDFIESGDEIHEIKKSSKMKAAHILQLKFYMKRAKESGIDVTRGVLHYPEENKTEEVKYDAGFDEDWESVEQDIVKIISNEKPMKRTVSMKLCRKCAYYELCHCG